jgi:preprotein translocase subunit SecG
MLYGLLLSVFITVCLLLVLIILIQQGKGSMGIGNLGGGAQMLFGGSGGQDVFQKITWVLGTLFMAGSLFLSLMRSAHTTSYARQMPLRQSAPISAPVSQPEDFAQPSE